MDHEPAPNRNSTYCGTARANQFGSRLKWWYRDEWRKPDPPTRPSLRAAIMGGVR
jgi:hypothetical protein